MKRKKEKKKKVIYSALCLPPWLCNSGIAWASGTRVKKWNWRPFFLFSPENSKMVDPKQIKVISNVFEI